MKNSNWEKDCPSQQEPPHPLCKTSKDVGQPGEETKPANDVTHDAPLKVWQIVIHVIKPAALRGLTRMLALLAWLVFAVAWFVDVRPTVPAAFLQGNNINFQHGAVLGVND
jgi:hypothetical protein